MFEYKVRYWDELDESGTSIIDGRGIVAANTYGEAAERVLKYFGKSNVIYMALCEMEDVLDTEELAEMLKNDKWFEPIKRF